MGSLLLSFSTAPTPTAHVLSLCQVNKIKLKDENSLPGGGCEGLKLARRKGGGGIGLNPGGGTGIETGNAGGTRLTAGTAGATGIFYE